MPRRHPPYACFKSTARCHDPTRELRRAGDPSSPHGRRDPREMPRESSKARPLVPVGSLPGSLHERSPNELSMSSTPMKTKKRPPKPTDADLAKRFGVTPKTISRWRAAGAPLGDGDRAMETWLAQRRQVPPGALPGLAQARLEEVLERVRRLRRENEVAEGRLVARSWVCERIAIMCGELSALQARSIEQHPVRLAAAGDDVAANRAALREVWDELRDMLQSLGEHLREGDPE